MGLGSWLTAARGRLAKAIAPTAPAPRGRAAYAAAQFNRLTQDWILATRRSAENELRYDLRTLRNRARELLRNSQFGERYHQILAENIIGPDGIRLQAKNLTKEGKLHLAANAGIEAAWGDWATPDNCDVAGKLSLTELLSLAVSNWGNDGEILIRFYRGPRFGPYGLQLQVLDPDLLDDQLYREASPGVNAIKQGVEVDELGKPVTYWLYKQHPDFGGVNQERVPVPAADIIHAFLPKRPGQPRGIPHASAVMMTIRMLDGYIEAELVAARTASATMGALEDISTDGTTAPASPDAGGGEIPMEAEPGALLDLRGRAAKLALWDPQHPTQAFPDFTKTLSRFAAIGLGVSYGTLTGDMSDANYSSMKVGRQPEIDHWKRFQGFVITHVLVRVYREFLAAALLNRRIPGITDFDPTRWMHVKWQARRWPSPDPIKDITADLMKVAAGTKTLTMVAAEDGLDLEEVLEERQNELALLAEYGITSTLPGQTTPVAKDETADEETTDEKKSGEDDEETPARAMVRVA